MTMTTTHQIRAPQAHQHQDAVRVPRCAHRDRRAQRVRRDRRHRHGRQQSIHRHRGRPAIAHGLRVQRVHGSRPVRRHRRRPRIRTQHRRADLPRVANDDTEPCSHNSPPSRSAAACSASSAPDSPSPQSPSRSPPPTTASSSRSTTSLGSSSASGFAGAAGAVLGAGIGAVVRNVGGAVTLTVFTFMVAPPLVVQLANGTASWMPANLANVISGTVDDVSQPAALAALVIWALIPAADRTHQPSNAATSSDVESTRRQPGGLVFHVAAEVAGSGVRIKRRAGGAAGSTRRVVCRRHEVSS